MNKLLLHPVFGFVRIVSAFRGKEEAAKLFTLVTAGERFSWLDQFFDPLLGRTVKRWTLLLPGKGCWWKKQCEGCTMCGFPLKIDEIGNTISNGELVQLYEVGETLTKKEKPETLSIFNGGSYLNNEEISHNTQVAILERVAEHPSLQKILVESRCEFINPAKIQSLVSALGEKKTLEIGIGLEAVTDEVRNRLIHKGLSRRAFEESINICHGNRARVLAYILIKPPGLDEKEAIDEAIRTAEYCFDRGVDEVALEATFIQEGTPLAESFFRGEYRPPWLWSIIEVIKATEDFGPIQLGGFDDEPQPIAIPHNCPTCSKIVESTLQQYREHHDSTIFKMVNCGCRKNEWEKSILPQQKVVAA